MADFLANGEAQYSVGWSERQRRPVAEGDEQPLQHDARVPLFVAFSDGERDDS